MWAKIKVVIRHTVAEQRLFGLPVVLTFLLALSSVFMEHCWLESKRVSGVFSLRLKVYLSHLFAQVTKDKNPQYMKG